MVSRLKNFTHRVGKALQDPERKSYFKLFREYFWFKVSNPALAEQYFEKFLYRQSVNNPDEFIITRKVMHEMWKLNDVRYVSILRDKFLTELFFSYFGIPVVKSIAYNLNSLFFFNGQVNQIDKVEDFRNLLAELKEKEIWRSETLIIKKKSDSSEGKNIFRITHSDILNNHEKLNSVFTEILKSDYLFQNFITQHPELSRINPVSVNTVRIDTFTNKKGDIKIFNSMLRTGSGSQFVDNVSLGGLAIGIDENNGMLFPDAHTFYTSFNPAMSRVKHPVTGINYKGFIVPYFEEAKLLALNAAKKIPEIKMAGWDIAIQLNGPVLIEGNNNSSIPLYEMLHQGFKQNPVVAEILEEVGNN